MISCCACAPDAQFGHGPDAEDLITAQNGGTALNPSKEPTMHGKREQPGKLPNADSVRYLSAACSVGPARRLSSSACRSVCGLTYSAIPARRVTRRTIRRVTRPADDPCSR